MPTKGEGCLINAVQVMEVTLTPASVATQGASLSAKYVLLNTETASRFGSGTFSTWSDETIGAYRALIRAMEKDICSVVFTASTPTGSDEKKVESLDDGVPGL